MALTAKKVYAILKRQISDMEAKLNSPVRYRGTVATADLLPLNPDIGDMYNIESKSVYGEAGMNVAWNGVVWDTMGAPIDMSLYFTKEEAESVIQRLVTEYFEKNPVKPGATTEQAQQIEQNKTDIASLKKETGSLKEDLSNKITKFYASSQSETNLQDSDNGKIMDMMLYGKSEQKQYSGKNLLNATLQTTTTNGVTCTNNGDGTYTLNGTATARTEFVISVFNIDISKKYKLIAFTKERSYTDCFVQLKQSPWTIYGSSKDSQVTIRDSENIRLVIAVIENNTLSNEIIKPMIVDASLYPDTTYDDFEPYTGGIPSPNPDYPQEIKSVVNPTVKVCGKNLLNPTLQTTTKNGVTCTNNGDGTYTLNGTATATGVFVLHSNINFTGQMRLCGGTSLVFLQYSNSFNFAYEDKGAGIIIEHFDSVTYPNASFNILIKANNVYNNVLIKPMLTTDLTATYDDFEPYHEQTVTLPYTLNAIPVSSGGNVTIDGQQYVSDYFDVERGKLVRMVEKAIALPTYVISQSTGNKNVFAIDFSNYAKAIKTVTNGMGITCMSNKFESSNTVDTWYEPKNTIKQALFANKTQIVFITDVITIDDFKAILSTSETYVIYQCEPIEESIPNELAEKLKALQSRYPQTNILITSDELDGYTVFNYPISMAQGWDYVKKQLNDNRDYIYDMDARTQDTDLQAAEAYVNSEYAVALTELEV